MPSKSSIPLQAALMALGTLLSRLLGLVREVLFASYFDRDLTDAWYAAFRLPNVFRRLFGEGALSVSFIPVFVEAEADSPERARNLVNGFYALFLVFLAVITGLGVLFPEQIFGWVLSANFQAQTEKLELTLRLAQIMFSYVFLVCTYAYFMAILNALGRFGLPAAAPTLFNVAMVGSVLWPQEWTSWRGQALAWGVVVGGILQIAILVPALIQKGMLPWPRGPLWSPDVKRVLKSMMPGLLGVGVLQINTLVNLNFATRLGEGPLSYLSLADRLLELPLSLISVSLGTALLPSLSRLAAEKKREAMGDLLAVNFRLNLFLCLAAAVGLWMLAHPIVEVLFQRGKFTADESVIVAGVVQIMTGVLIFTSAIRVLVSGFYAVKNTWWPATASGIALAVHVVMAPVLMAEYGLSGLNWSSVLSLGVNAALIALAYPWLVGPFHWLPVLRSLLQWAPALVGMAAVLWTFDGLWQPEGTWLRLFGLLGFVALGGLVFLIVSHWCRVPEAEQFLRALRRRWDRSRT